MTYPEKSTAPEIIHKLVETFEKNIDEYRNSKNETELRIQFLDKFFAALGWDVANEKGYDEVHKEVVHEFSVEVAGQGKKADYAFRTGAGADKFDFLVEAKKPSVRVESSQEAAFQVRRYGWSAKIPINILTDFEHFAVYDCRAKPNYNDKASFGRIMLIHYKDYVRRWDEIAEIFSPEAVRKGSLAKYIEGTKGKKGTADVDDAFLQEIERWRELLAKNIALRNEGIDVPGLNYAVQMIIDRIVFLRICEERGIEPENQLHDIANKDGVYQELCALFKRADAKYNSGLFHFKKEKDLVSRPDDLTPTLDIDDKVLKDIISNLYFPKSPYAFLYIPSDILGQVYERFLGKVIRLTAGHQAKVEEKPEVRKAGGVYYTPTYIVDYIVKNTVGKLVEGKTPAEVANLKIVDPACGSGTFLLGAYQFLLDWHLNWYAENDAEKWVKAGSRLTTAKKKEILLNNIHGVDIDAQAVEVTKLSLLLKVLENASGQLELGMQRALPDLGNNIKCGNSLIGFDYFEGQMFPDEEERARVNPFDWHSEFKDVFARGGFDAVIGNPPYDVMEKERGESSWPHTALVEYARNNPDYTYAMGGKLNLFRFFVVHSITLLKLSGRFGMIIPLALLADISCSKTRQYAITNSDELIADCFPQKDNPSRRIFRDAKLSTCIITSRHKPVELEKAKILVRIYPWNTFEDKHREAEINLSDILLIDSVNTPIPLVDSTQWRICKKIYNQEKIKRLNDVVDFLVTRGEINQTIYREYISENSKHSRLLKGVEVGQYRINRKLSQGKREWFDEGSFLKSNNEKSIVHRRRIATQRITGVDEKLRIVATLIDPPCYFADSTNSISTIESTKYKLEYLLGLLNSWLFQWRFKLTSSNNNVATNELDSMPIRAINFSDPAEKAQHDKMVSLVEQMLALHKSLARAKSPQEKERLERQIEATDKAIDSLVYELYGLTEEEIRIVEGRG
jgi:Alw26I/Eco31I/Esp3I family type II restriction m6 adenine DNA methyltransferase